MYKYILLACLLVMAVGVMVEAQGMSGMQSVPIVPEGMLSGQSQMSSAVRMLGTQPVSGSASGSNMANALALARRMSAFPRLFSPFLQRQILASALYGFDLNDLLLMHYFDFGLF